MMASKTLAKGKTFQFLLYKSNNRRVPQALHSRAQHYTASSSHGRSMIYTITPTNNSLKMANPRQIHSTPPIDPSPPLPTFQVPDHLFSPNPSPETLAGIIALLACTKAPWELVHSPPGIQRSFTFKTFNQAMKFMNAVADECKVQRHHPEWANVYNKVVVRWTTHNPKGISEKDVYMAKWCDDAGERFGAIEQKGNVVGSSSVEEMKATVGGAEKEVAAPGDTRHVGTSEIAYPGMPDNTPRHKKEGDDLVTSLLGPGDQECAPCMTGKEKSKATGTESGPGYKHITPKDTSPRLDSTAGRSVLEEIQRKKDTHGLSAEEKERGSGL